MIEAPVCGSRCQSSSVMNGMNGWSNRSVVSSTVTRVCWVRRRWAGFSGRYSESFAISRYQSQNSCQTNW